MERHSHLFLERLHRAVDDAFPRTLLRCVACLSGIRGGRLASSPRRTRTVAQLKGRLEGVKNDADFQTYLMWKAHIGEVGLFYHAALRVLSRMGREQPDSAFYECVKRELGATPQAIALVRIGLVISYSPA